MNPENSKPDFLQRLETEESELKTKRDALGSFINSDKFKDVSTTQRHLLCVQLKAMDTYLECLNLRILDLAVTNIGQNKS